MDQLVLKTSLEVAKRAGIVYCMAVRQGIESMLVQQQGAVPENAKESCKMIGKTVQHSFFVPTVTKKENRLLLRESGRWTMKDMARRERCWEQLGILAWALKAPGLEVPDFDEHFNREKLVKEVMVGGPATLPIYMGMLANNGLRSKEEIWAMLERAQAWQWRAHMQVLHPDNVINEQAGEVRGCHDVEEYEERLKAGAMEAKSKGAVNTIINNDFGVFRTTPYRDLDKPTLGALASISQTRLFTLGWIGSMFDWME